MKKVSKTIALFMALFMLAALVTACAGQKVEVPAASEPTAAATPASADATPAAATPAQPAAKVQKTGLILTVVGLGDKNFNDMSFMGLKLGQERLGVGYDYAEPKAAADYETLMRQYAESGDYSLIICLGADQLDALTKVCGDFPEQKFTIIDAKLEAPNVTSIFTYQQEQTFLSGVLAGLATTDTANFPLANEDKKLGIVLGMDSPIQRLGQVGFTAGAKFVDAAIDVDCVVVGSYNDPAKGLEIANSMYSKGADIIHQFCGASGLGVFNAAKENNKYAIGGGMSQNGIDPEHIMCTSERKVYEIVFNEIEKVSKGTWKAGVITLGIADNSVGYTLEGTNVKIPQDIIDKLEKIKALAVEGKIKIPNKLEDIDAWVKDNNIGLIS